jgi:hypothetical protein
MKYVETKSRKYVVLDDVNPVTWQVFKSEVLKADQDSDSCLVANTNNQYSIISCPEDGVFETWALYCFKSHRMILDQNVVDNVILGQDLNLFDWVQDKTFAIKFMKDLINALPTKQYPENIMELLFPEEEDEND